MCADILRPSSRLARSPFTIPANADVPAAVPSGVGAVAKHRGVRRRPSSVFLIALAGLALFVAVQTVRDRRKFQPPMTTWYAAMLFAVMPLRNALPDSPPFGFWIDVTIVLWVIVIVGVLDDALHLVLVAAPETRQPDSHGQAGLTRSWKRYGAPPSMRRWTPWLIYRHDREAWPIAVVALYRRRATDLLVVDRTAGHDDHSGPAPPP
jgi:hypothetical protein